MGEDGSGNIPRSSILLKGARSSILSKGDCKW